MQTWVLRSPAIIHKGAEYIISDENESITVVTSSGSDTYSVISAAMSSLKGKKHGGVNLMVMNMMDDIKSHVKDYEDEEEIASYLSKILKKEAFDQKGLIYGMEHAVYSISRSERKGVQRLCRTTRKG